MITALPAEIIALPHPECGMPKDSTVLWSPIFQAAWKKLNSKTGEPVRIEPPDELMSKLDSFKFDHASTFPAGSWKVWAGNATPDFLAQVNKEAAEITGEKEGPFTLQSPPDSIKWSSAAAFGILDRKLEFKTDFYRSSTKAIDFRAGGTETACQFFGTAGDLSSQYGNSIRILGNDHEMGTHALELSCKEEEESVVIFLPGSAMTFAKACEEIRGLKAGFDNSKGTLGSFEDPRFHGKDILKIPYVSLDKRQSFPELLKSVRHCGAPEKPWKITRTEQLTRFELNEKGARVRVETSLSADPFGSPPPKPTLIPRSFIYDRPFFVLLWKDGAEWPYFGAWIGDASALKPFP